MSHLEQGIPQNEEDLIFQDKERQQNMYMAVGFGGLIATIIAIALWNKDTLIDSISTSKSTRRLDIITQVEHDDRPTQWNQAPVGHQTESTSNDNTSSSDDKIKTTEPSIQPQSDWQDQTEPQLGGGFENTNVLWKSRSTSMISKAKGLLRSGPVLVLAFMVLVGVVIYQLYAFSAPMIEETSIFNSWLEAGTMVHTMSFALIGLILWGVLMLAYKFIKNK